MARREASLNLVRYGRLIKRWWWLLLFAGAIGGGGAYGVSQVMTPVYRADVTLLINQTQDPGVIAYNDILTSERLTMTYAEMITKRPILESVAEAMDGAVTAEQLAAMTHVGTITDTQLLRLSVEDTDRDEARVLANTTAKTFITSTEQDGLIRPGTISIVEPAATPASPVQPRTTLNTFLGALAGLLVAAAAIAVYEYLDDTMKTSDEVEAVAGIATLGSVSRFRTRSLANRGLPASSGERAPEAEEYRVLRTNLQFTTVDAKALLVSSAGPEEGKTTTVANLAVAIAQTGSHVIAIDSDLRRPALHKIFGLSGGAGLTNALLQHDPHVDQLLQPTSIKNLWILSSGPLPPNPAELLNSARMDTIIQALRMRADILLFDSPPLCAVADASILAAKCDGAILVVDSGRTRAQALRRACDALSRSKTRVLGAVLNKLADRRGGGYGYGYYYGPSSNGTNGHRRRWLPLGRNPATAEVRKSAA